MAILGRCVEYRFVSKSLWSENEPAKLLNEGTDNRIFHHNRPCARIIRAVRVRHADQPPPIRVTVEPEFSIKPEFFVLTVLEDEPSVGLAAKIPEVLCHGENAFQWEEKVCPGMGNSRAPGYIHALCRSHLKTAPLTGGRPFAYR